MSESVGYGPPVQRDGATPMTGTLTNNVSYVLAGANGETWTQGQATEVLAVSTSATTDTTANLLPANSRINAVVVRVLQAIPTAATFSLGDAATTARFTTGVAVAVTTTAVGITQLNSTGAAAAGPGQTAAAKVRVTPDVQPGTSTGLLRISVFYDTFVAPTTTSTS